MSQPPKPPIQKPRGLGRGLSALLGDDEVAATVAPAPAPTPPPLPDYPSKEVANTNAPNRPPLTLPIGQLKPGKMQPRTSFEGIDLLVESVKEFGLLQPIRVREDEPRGPAWADMLGAMGRRLRGLDVAGHRAAA